MDEAQQLDIVCLVEHYRQVYEQLWPLRAAWDFIVSIWRWESFGLSLFVVSLAAFITLFPPMLLAVMLCSILLWVLAGLWNAQSTHSPVTTQPPQGQLQDEDREAMKNCRREEKSTISILQASRTLIKTADTMLLQIMNTISYFKSIFHWTNARLSLSVMVVCVIVLMMLIRAVSVPTLLSLVIVIVFFSSPHFTQICKQKIAKTLKSPKESTSPQTPTPPSPMRETSTGDVQEATVTTGTGPVGAMEISLEETNSSHPPTDAGDRFQLSTRIMAPSTGSCFQCNSLFTLLKRKYQCNLCGHMFCNNCSVKVLRSSLGATSPAAYTENVRVCLECKNNL